MSTFNLLDIMDNTAPKELNLNKHHDLRKAWLVGGGIKNVDKINNLPNVTDKLYHIILCQLHVAIDGSELTTLSVIATDSIGRYKKRLRIPKGY